MRPRNEMSEICNSDFDCEILSETLVRFRFNLVAHPALRDPNVVKRCMLEYVFAYPTVTGWAGKIDGTHLVIDVNGRVEPRYYGKHEGQYV